MDNNALAEVYRKALIRSLYAQEQQHEQNVAVDISSPVEGQITFTLGFEITVETTHSVNPEQIAAIYGAYPPEQPVEEDITGMLAFLPPGELVDAFRDVCRGVIELWPRILGSQAQCALSDWIATAELHSDPALLADLQEQESALERGEGVDWDEYRHTLPYPDSSQSTALPAQAG